jgi:LPS O-antigen subunit length determinant protein (WzzB/FepE family)
MNSQRDFSRQFRPTADQEYANRPLTRFDDRPARDSVVVLAFLVGAMLGAVITLGVLA